MCVWLAARTLSLSPVMTRSLVVAVLATAAVGTGSAVRLRAGAGVSTAGFVGSLLKKTKSWVLKKMPCSCEYGDASDGCFFKRQERCGNCAFGFHLNGHVCMPNICSCENGVSVSLGACPADGGVACAACDAGFVGAPGECARPEGTVKAKLETSLGAKAPNPAVAAMMTASNPAAAAAMMASGSSPGAAKALNPAVAAMMAAANPAAAAVKMASGSGPGAAKAPIPAVAAMVAASNPAAAAMMATGPGASTLSLQGVVGEGTAAKGPGEAPEVMTMEVPEQLMGSTETGGEDDLKKSEVVVAGEAMTGPKEEMKKVAEDMQGEKMTGPEEEGAKNGDEDKPGKGAMTGPVEDDLKEGDDDMQGETMAAPEAEHVKKGDEDKPGEEEAMMGPAMTGPAMTGPAMTGPEEDYLKKGDEDTHQGEAMTGPEDDVVKKGDEVEGMIGSYGETGSGEAEGILTALMRR